MLLRLDDTALLTVFNDSGAINGWYLPQFLIQSVPAARQAKRATGNLAVSVLRDADRAFLDPHMPLDVPPPRSTRSARRWSSAACIGLRPELVAEGQSPDLDRRQSAAPGRL
jgi:hypothetical protein